MTGKAWCGIQEAKRSYLQFDARQDVAVAVIVWILNPDDVTVIIIGIDATFPVKDGGDPPLQRGADVVRRLLLHALVELVLLGVASVLHRVVLRDQPPVQNQVDVLGETLYQMEYLGKRRAALEAEKPAKILVTKDS